MYGALTKGMWILIKHNLNFFQFDFFPSLFICKSCSFDVNDGVIFIHRCNLIVWRRWRFFVWCCCCCCCCWPHKFNLDLFVYNFFIPFLCNSFSFLRGLGCSSSSSSFHFNFLIFCWKYWVFCFVFKQQ